MRKVISMLCVVQLFPTLWLVSWAFSPAHYWTWQWVPSVVCTTILYCGSMAVAYKGLKSIAKGKK